MKLSIIIPVFNEEKRIASAIKKVSEFLAKKKFDYELIIVDDGCSDSTIKCAVDTGVKLTVIKNTVNLGKGGAVRNGMLHSSGDYLLFTDVDISTPLEELNNFLPWIDTGFDVVIGSRSIRGSDVRVRQPLYRELMGKFFNKIVRLLTVRGIIDTQCGFKLFTRKCGYDVFSKQTINRFCFDVEVLFLAQKLGYGIKELPVVWRNDVGSTVNPVKDSLRMLRDLFRIRFNDLIGKYN